MTQPNNFGFGEEATLLKESARKFFADNLSTQSLHALVASDHSPEKGPQCAWDQALWAQMKELGWTLLAVPEERGGVGMPLVGVAGLVEELGGAAFPCPLIATLSSCYVLSACGKAGESPLEEVAAGNAATLVMTNSEGSWLAGDTPISCEDGKLNGTAFYVQDAAKVEKLLVVAKSSAGLSLYWVDADAAGVSIAGDAIVDLTRDQAHVSFDNVTAQLLSENALGALNAAFPAIWTLHAADMVGAAEWQLQTTVEYVNTRQQFEHPLGFFQAVKHPLVDVMVQIDQAKSLTYNAACAVDAEPEKASQFAHMAQASASDVAAFASSRSVQTHGGIGFTWECFVHIYFKRQKHSQMLWGDAAWHRACLADILIGAVA